MPGRVHVRRRHLRLVHNAQRALVPGLAGLVLAGCLGSDGEQAPSDAGARLGPSVRLTDCRDWREFSPRERSATIRELRAFSGGPTGSPAGRGTTLDDDDAYRLFDGYCEQPFAGAFKLYKLYTRAASFGRPASPER